MTMMEYVQLSDAEKLALLQEHGFQVEFSTLESTCWCLHCEKEIVGRDAHVYRYRGELWLECGTPGCDGSPIDWFPCPWWDRDHPVTVAYRERVGEPGSEFLD